MSRNTPPLNPQGMVLRLYHTVSPALVALSSRLAPFSAKLEAGVRGREGLMQRLTASAPSVRGGVWFHVTSVGEYEQARPIIEAIKASSSPPPVMVTHFSPSGYDYALQRPCADVHEYLPFDHPDHMDRLVRMWQPRLLVFVKFDCWPNQVLAAAHHRVPVVLLAGSLQPQSPRLHPMAKGMFREVFNHFAHLGVCTPDDAHRFVEKLGVACPVSVTGDTRVEQVILRFEAARDGACATKLKNLGGRLLILGSTWPPDEKLWLPILPDLLQEFPDLKVVLTPHEPLPLRLTGLEKILDGHKIINTRLSQLMATGAGTRQNTRVILVDSIGVLAEIYRSGHLAYVGGSFTTGVHKTMELAVAAMPLLFGPRIQNAEEAGMLVSRQAGFVLHKPEDALAQARQLLSDSKLLEVTGGKARQVVLDQRGATERCLRVIEPFLKPSWSENHAT